MSNDALIQSASTVFNEGAQLEALRLTEDIIRLDPDSFEAWSLLGSIHARMHFPLQAAYAYGRALRLRKNDLASLTSLGECLLEAQKHRAAASVLKLAMHLDPDAKHPAGCRARAVVARTLASLRSATGAQS